MHSHTVALLCGFLTQSLLLSLFYFFIFFALQHRDEMHILYPEVTAPPPSLLDWNDNEETMQAEYS